jgi:hypothetical protein
MQANERQVGGEHYRTEIQHWDFVAANELNYFEGQATKYITRCRKKNGKQDIEKAIHYLQKYLEVYDQMTLPPAKDPYFDAKAVEEAYIAEVAARENYELEGYRADGMTLFKCKHCRQEGWGKLALQSPVDHAPSCPLHPGGKSPPAAP